MSEVPIASGRANVMLYDDAAKKWVASGTTQGLSKVQIYRHTTNNTFRVVGRKLQDHEVVINCAIIRGLKYNQATPTFHQWRDNRQVYGLNFANKEDAECFAQAMATALDTINNAGRPGPPAMPPPGVPPQPQQNGPDPGDYQRHQRHPSGGAPPPQYREPQQVPAMQPHIPPQIPSQPVVPPGPPISAPPVPAAPPMAPPAPAAPPAPPAPPAPGAPPAPPPPSAAPPAPSGGGGGGLAAALQQAKLKKIQNEESSGGSGNGGISSNSSSASLGSMGGGGGGGGDFMSDLAKKLAMRKKASQNESPSNEGSTPPEDRSKRGGSHPPPPAPVKIVNGTTNSPTPARNSAHTLPRNFARTYSTPSELSNRVSAEVPNRTSLNKVLSRQPSLTGQETTTSSLPPTGASGGSGDLESLKQEILSEMRLEMNKMKSEIIAAIQQTMNAR